MERVNVKIRKIYDKIPYKCKFAFLSAMIFGLIAHLYMFMNKLPNKDDVGISGFGATFRLGRWFLWFLGSIAWHLGLVYSLSWVNGLITIVLLSLSAAIIVDLLEIDNNLSVIIISAVLTVFPSWTSTFFFMFASPYYAIAVFFMVLAVVLDYKYNKKIIAAILIACSIGIYQAYIPFVASFYVTILITRIYENGYDVGKLFKKSISSLVTLGAGLLLYIIIMKISLALTAQQLSNYRGISGIGSYSISIIPNMMKRLIRDGIGVAFNDNLELSYGVILKLGYLALYIVDIVIVVFSVVGFCKNKEVKRARIFLLYCLAFIISVNLIFIMCPEEGAIYSLMTYSYAFLIILPVSIVDKAIGSPIIEWKKVCIRLEYGVIAVGFTMVLAYCHFANAQYLSMQLGFNQTLSYYTTVITQIKSLEGYSDEMSVSLVYDDNHIEDATLYRNDIMRAFDNSARDDVLEESYSREIFLQNFCGFSPKFVNIYGEYKDEIDEMPNYPNEGSIKIIDNVVVVKFS
jgi:hypothetical protein